MYHQFKELADVDITTDAMEIGPTCHYIMGGVRVEADTCQTTIEGLFAAGEVAGGMHGANRLGGNSLSDLLVFGRRAGMYAAEHAKQVPGEPVIDEVQVEAICQHALSYFEHTSTMNPYTLHHELQDTMQDLVGIIRTESELVEAREKLGEYDELLPTIAVDGHRQFNPGWHLALDLESMLAIARCITLSAIERRESRGGHTRDDFPLTDPTLGTVNMTTSMTNHTVGLRREPLAEMPEELQELFEEAH
jgi:succinate dehydrogenase / fumarate reductase flavoprotein subunit